MAAIFLSMFFRQASSMASPSPPTNVNNGAAPMSITLDLNELLNNYEIWVVIQ